MNGVRCADLVNRVLKFRDGLRWYVDWIDCLLLFVFPVRVAVRKVPSLLSKLGD